MLQCPFSLFSSCWNVQCESANFIDVVVIGIFVLGAERVEGCWWRCKDYEELRGDRRDTHCVQQRSLQLTHRGYHGFTLLALVLTLCDRQGQLANSKHGSDKLLFLGSNAMDSTNTSVCS